MRQIVIQEKKDEDGEKYQTAQNQSSRHGPPSVTG